MIDVEKEKYRNLSKGMNEEEQKIFLSEIPTSVLCDELKRRSEEAETKLAQIENFFKEGERR